jgi:prepilin-type N-terminal cleavage/methylation domain-containing protein
MKTNRPRSFIAVVSALRRRSAGEQGFGLIELMVAISIILVALLAISYTALIGFTDIAFARQRQSATGLANQAIEQASALPLDTLARGLSNADLAGSGDPNITTSGCGSGTVYCLTIGGLNEQIPRGDNPNVVPIVPHTQTINIGPTRYTVRTYVSYFRNDPSLNTLRLSTLVSWVGAERGSALHTINVESLRAAPAGCLSTRTHPFAAPCQPFFFSTTDSGHGHIDVSGTLAEKGVDHMSLFPPNFGSAIQIEQVSAIQGTAQTAGISAQLTGGSESVAGGTYISTGSDNDPAQQKPAYQTASVPSASAGTLVLDGSDATLTGTESAGDTAVSTSTVSAGAANPCPNVSGFVNLSTAQPCGGSSAQIGGTDSIVLAVNSEGTNLGSGTLASVTKPLCVPSCPNQAMSYRFIAPNGSMCPGASGEGCIHGEAARTFGVVTLGGLPANVSAPVGWLGYLVKLWSWKDSASAEVGIGSTDPTVSAPIGATGSISFWNGLGYTTCTVYQANCPASGANFPVTAVNRTVVIGGKTVVVTMSAAITTGGTSVTEVPASCVGTCTRTQSTVTSGSPLLGDITYTVSVGGNRVCTLNIHVDLGALLVNTIYKPAPTS